MAEVVSLLKKKKDSREPPYLLPFKWGHSKMTSSMSQETGSPDTEFAGPWSWLSLQNCDQFVYKLSNLWDSLQQPERTKTIHEGSTVFSWECPVLFDHTAEEVLCKKSEVSYIKLQNSYNSSPFLYLLPKCNSKAPTVKEWLISPDPLTLTGLGTCSGTECEWKRWYAGSELRPLETLYISTLSLGIRPPL